MTPKLSREQSGHTAEQRSKLSPDVWTNSDVPQPSGLSVNTTCPYLTCPRSRVTFTSLYSVLRDRGGLCHHRSVPSMALVMGWARSLSPCMQMSQYWPWEGGDRHSKGLIFTAYSLKPQTVKHLKLSTFDTFSCRYSKTEWLVSEWHTLVNVRSEPSVFKLQSSLSNSSTMFQSHSKLAWKEKIVPEATRVEFLIFQQSGDSTQVTVTPRLELVLYSC